VWSDDALMLGLAKLCRIPREHCPPDASAWLDAAITPGDHMLTVPADWDLAGVTSIDELETRWFAPLLHALKERRLQRLTVYPRLDRAYHVDAARLRRWWVRRVPLTRVLNEPT
jgi:hypothetical protein